MTILQAILLVYILIGVHHQGMAFALAIVKKINLSPWFRLKWVLIWPYYLYLGFQMAKKLKGGGE